MSLRQRARSVLLRLRGYRDETEQRRDELEDGRESAREEVRRAIRRANHLWDAAHRLPTGSNGRRKKERDAKMIAQGAYDTAVRWGIEEEFFRGGQP